MNDDPHRPLARADYRQAKPGEAPESVDAVIFDVDGTLVDTNYLHVIAWSRAFAEFDVPASMWKIHRGIGMGGEKLVAYVADEVTEERLGPGLRKAWDEHYTALLPEVRAFPDAGALLRDLERAGIRVALASSGQPDHVARALEVIDAGSAITAVVSAEDAETKPEPDLIDRAVEAVSAHYAVMVGDSVWDVVAAGRSGYPTVGVLTGGFGRDELELAGAHLVMRDPAELRSRTEELLRRMGRTHW